MAVKNFSGQAVKAEVTWPEEKRCGHCKHLKPASEFHKEKRRHDGLSWSCKTCKSARMGTYNAQPKAKAAAYTRSLKSKYGLSREDYDRMLTAQAGGCAICGHKSPKKNLSVDHDHSCCPGVKSCGKCVRGLLCQQCNHKILGYWLRESSKGTEQALATARRLVAYLEGGQDGRDERAA